MACVARHGQEQRCAYDLNPACTPCWLLCLYRLYRSKMEMKDKLYFTDLAVPPGAALHRVNTALPILKLAK